MNIAIKHLLISLTAFFVWCCSPLSEDKPEIDEMIEYDGYYWMEKGGQLRALLPVDRIQFIIYDAQYKTEVESHLSRKGFEFYEEPTYETFEDWFQTGYEIPEHFRNVGIAKVTGDESIKDIPHIIYSNHCYKHPYEDKVIGNFFILTITCTTQEETILADEYADQLGLVKAGYTLSSGVDKTFFNVNMFCTNQSAGNCVEICNWLMENTMYNSISFDYYNEIGTSIW